MAAAKVKAATRYEKREYQQFEEKDEKRRKIEFSATENMIYSR